jgi:hypothetical protein
MTPAILRVPLLLVMLAVCYTSAFASGAGRQAEIDHLLGNLARSECQFNRNGTWYEGPEAVGHIRTKYRFLVDHDLVETTEQFIERAGSESSLSGKPYLVRCGAAEPMKSADWFHDELARYRAGSGSRP